MIRNARAACTAEQTPLSLCSWFAYTHTHTRARPRREREREGGKTGRVYTHKLASH